MDSEQTSFFRDIWLPCRKAKWPKWHFNNIKYHHEVSSCCHFCSIALFSMVNMLLKLKTEYLPVIDVFSWWVPHSEERYHILTSLLNFWCFLACTVTDLFNLVYSLWNHLWFSGWWLFSAILLRWKISNHGNTFKEKWERTDPLNELRKSYVIYQNK